MFVAQSSVKKLRLVPNVKSDLNRFLLKCQSVKVSKVSFAASQVTYVRVSASSLNTCI